jgi:SsrA-binding protein
MEKKAPAKIIALNRKAHYEYTLEDYFEAGIVLEGWEAKSLRAGKAQLTESYVIIKKGEAWWLGGLITPLLSASTHIKPDSQRTRKLLLHKAELNKLIGAVERKGYTLIPVNLHWHKGRAKMEIALAKGKQLHDKRASEKEKDWQREKQRMGKTNIKG